ncbi:MAG: Uncharacterized protein G01um10147_811 [Microgenomates group bacterium Gr01-1014_7]|nr:MAG: Uncharacterized protein G01um10147_811 [Microgenomates group bacterium Gr01-1014_7]
MDDTKKMLRAIINGQSVFRQEILAKIDKLDKKLEGMINRVDEKLTERIDKLGMHLAYVDQLEQQPTSQRRVLPS